MVMFECFIDRCLKGFQFCETQSERCRDCKDYIEYCFKDNLHISNCSSYCYDMMLKNVTSATKIRTHPEGFYLPENYHLLIECSLIFVIIVFIIMAMYPRFRFLAGITQRVFTVNQAVEATAEKNETQTFIAQYSTEEGQELAEVKASNGEYQQMSNTNNCGFTQHNQISNASKDNPLLCPSGQKENIKSLIT